VALFKESQNNPETIESQLETTIYLTYWFSAGGRK